MSPSGSMSNLWTTVIVKTFLSLHQLDQKKNVVFETLFYFSVRYMYGKETKCLVGTQNYHTNKRKKKSNLGNQFFKLRKLFWVMTTVLGKAQCF